MVRVMLLPLLPLEPALWVRSSFNSNCFEDKVVNIAGVYNSTYNLDSVTNSWMIHVVTFKSVSNFQGMQLVL